MSTKEPKVILVTGASSGIGREAALQMAAKGHKVYGAARRENQIPAPVIALHMDVTDEASVEAALQTILEKEGRLDVLVNNAGYGYFGPLEHVSLEEARKQLDVNLFGMASLTRRVIPLMREQGGGRIVNISSVAGRMCFYFGGWYNISKYAVEAFSDVLRMETKPFGIDVAIVEPGFAKTEWGTIAADHLRESTRDTLYEEMAESEARLLGYAFGRMKFPGPTAVAKAVAKASLSRRPRLRYHPGGGGVALLILRKLMPARWWDAMLRGALKMSTRITF